MMEQVGTSLLVVGAFGHGGFGIGDVVDPEIGQHLVRKHTTELAFRPSLGALELVAQCASQRAAANVAKLGSAAPIDETNKARVCVARKMRCAFSASESMASMITS